MVFQVRSLGLQGVSGYEVSAECDLSSGLPAFTLVGLPDAAVNEARERVRSAIKNCGFQFPVSRITVNLAPAHVKKSGTLYDLPILVGILAAGGQLKVRDPDCAFVGELSLGGRLRPCAGMLPMAMAAREQGTPVNLYQTIQPRGLRFLLDGESFCGLSQDWRELEGALEVLASVLSGLSGAGVDCSLSLPHSRLFGPMTVSSGEGGGDDLLFYLAGYRCLAQRVPEESRSPQGPAFLPSRFAADAAPQSGTAYLITCSGSRLPAALMERLDPGQLWVLCAQDWEVPARAGFRSLSLDSLRKGGSRP